MDKVTGTSVFGKISQPSFWFLFYEGKIFVETDREGKAIPCRRIDSTIRLRNESIQWLGDYQGHSCVGVELTELPQTPLNGYNLRQLYGQLPEELFWLAGKAAHLLHWDKTSRFCGSCGTPLRWLAKERGKECPHCGQLVFPRISPAVIVAVTDATRILLARGARFTSDMYSVLAGFVESGETLEECVHREIKEEVGIEVTDLRYFGSQPWPFPDSLMVAFTAKYAGGELRLDPNEIVDAQWFTVDNLPTIPDKLSVARKLIDWFCRRQSQSLD